MLDPVDGGGRTRVVSGRVSLDLGVVDDGRVEAPDELTMVLLGGAGAMALLAVVIEDADLAYEVVPALRARCRPPR